MVVWPVCTVHSTLALPLNCTDSDSMWHSLSSSSVTWPQTQSPLVKVLLGFGASYETVRLFTVLDMVWPWYEPSDKGQHNTDTCCETSWVGVARGQIFHRSCCSCTSRQRRYLVDRGPIAPLSVYLNLIFSFFSLKSRCHIFYFVLCEASFTTKVNTGRRDRENSKHHARLSDRRFFPTLCRATHCFIAGDMNKYLVAIGNKQLPHHYLTISISELLHHYLFLNLEEGC